MKLKIILAASICLNAAFAVMLLQRDSTSPEIVETIVQITNTVPSVAEQPVTNQVVSTTAPAPLDWRAVESDDYKEYIENLRAIGCPESTIRDIIIADVNKLYESRGKKESPLAQFEYWKPGNPFANVFNEDKMAENQQRAAEKRALLKELLGEDVEVAPDLMAGIDPFETMLGFLPESSRNDIVELEQKFAARTMERMKDARNNPEVMRDLMAEKDVELLRILGPDQKFEYDLRMSQSAMIMRMQMTDFEPTEEEFRAMFRMRKAFDDEYSPLGVPAIDPDQRKARESAQKELENQMRNVLGEDRFHEYKRDQDWSQSSLRFVATQYDVPKENAMRVFDLRDAAQAEAERVRADPTLNPTQRAAALDAIRVETEGAVAGVIGVEAARAYVENGSWIKRLNQ